MKDLTLMLGKKGLYYMLSVSSFSHNFHGLRHEFYTNFAMLLIFLFKFSVYKREVEYMSSGVL